MQIKINNDNINIRTGGYQINNNDKNIETIFLMSDPDNQVISSKFVKEIAKLNKVVKPKF